MTGKITAAVVAAILFASAGVASAQTNRHSARVALEQTNGHSPRTSSHWQAPYSDSYYNKDYWDGVGVRTEQRDPYVGTVFEGVAPY
jgi:hypothetical protein